MRDYNLFFNGGNNLNSFEKVKFNLFSIVNEFV